MSQFNILDFVHTVSTKTYRKDDVIFKQNEPSNGLMYFLFNGELEVYKERHNNRELIGTMKPGDFFGEMAIVNALPRAATITVKSGPARLGMLDKATFLKVGKAAPAFFYILLKTVIDRLVNAEKRLEVLQNEKDKLS